MPTGTHRFTVFPPPNLTPRDEHNEFDMTTVIPKWKTPGGPGRAAQWERNTPHTRNV